MPLPCATNYAPEAAEVVAKAHRRLPDDAHSATTMHRCRPGVLQAGIEQVHAELRPDGQGSSGRAQLRARQPTAMVGDGVNDARPWPTWGMRWVTGTDVAIETADVALMGQDLRHLP